MDCVMVSMREVWLGIYSEVPAQRIPACYHYRILQLYGLGFFRWTGYSRVLANIWYEAGRKGES